MCTGCAKLGLPNSGVRVVLEMDGTEVDEEDYFSFLNSDATLMLLTPADQWRPAGLGMPKCACAADCKLYIYCVICTRN